MYERYIAAQFVTNIYAQFCDPTTRTRCKRYTAAHCVTNMQRCIKYILRYVEIVRTKKAMQSKTHSLVLNLTTDFGQNQT